MIRMKGVCVVVATQHLIFRDYFAVRVGCMEYRDTSLKKCIKLLQDWSGVCDYQAPRTEEAL